MTEVALTTDSAPTPATVATFNPGSPTPGSTVDLTSYWDRMGVAIQIAGPMCKTPFVPSAFRNKPEDTAMAIMYGLKYGMEPDAALSSIFLIGGRPGMYSRVQHALLLAHGHDVRIVTQTPELVEVRGRRKGDEGDWTVVRWTIERARQAGYFTNDKYKTDPIAMLTARALGDCCRLVAPDLLMGIVAYNEADVEVMEVLDGDTLQPLAKAPAAAPVRVERPRPAAAPPRAFVDVTAPAPAAPAEPAVEEPLAGPEAEVTVEEEPTVEYDDGVTNVYEFPQSQAIALANEMQVAAMMNELTAAGHRTIAAKRKAAKEFVGRDLEGPHQMTADEADRFINHLMREREGIQTPAVDVDAQWGLKNEENK